MKAMPEFALVVKPLIDKPGKAMEATTPGVSLAIWPMRSMTLVVRSMEAPSGNCPKAMRYCLSCCGMKPLGTCLKTTPVSQTRPR